MTKEDKNLSAFYLESDKRRAKIGLLLLFFPIVLFSINDFVFFGLGSSTFYGLIALRGGLLTYTIVQFFYLNRVKSYVKYSALMAFWTMVAAVSVVLINLTRPPSFIPLQLVTTLLFVLITFAIIPNKLRYQICSAAIISIGEIGILFYFSQITPNFFIAGTGSLILAFLIGLTSSWQLETYRRENFEAHERLRQSRDRSEAKYEQLVEKLPEMVFELDNQGHIVFANLKAIELTGYTKEEFERNFDANRLVAPEDLERSVENMKLMFAKGKRYSGEYVWIRKDGKRFPVQLTSVPVLDDGRIVGVRGIISDLTERKNLEKQLQDNERLAAIGQTAGMVGHDIRNPLQAITNNLYLLKKKLAASPNFKSEGITTENLDSIERDIGYINKIVQDLQDFSRPITPEITEVNLSNTLANIFQTIKIPDNVKLSISIMDARTIKTDPVLIQRALTNLITNAIQAMPNGGNLEICGQQADSYIVITVADTGVGIPEDVKTKLFTPMMTTKAKGQGFGLAVSKRIIEAMKGSISFESQEGKGTKFIVKLPLC